VSDKPSSGCETFSQGLPHSDRAPLRYLLGYLQVHLLKFICQYSSIGNDETKAQLASAALLSAFADLFHHGVSRLSLAGSAPAVDQTRAGNLHHDQEEEACASAVAGRGGGGRGRHAETAVAVGELTSGAKADGRFDKADFIYDAQKNEYRSPADQALIWRFATVEDGMKLHRYWSSNCKGCPLKEKCTPSPQRRITRWEHQDVLDDMQVRLDRDPAAMRVRRSTVEHPFGTIKAWMGSTHFLTKGLERVKTEMSLHVLAYNLKRLMALLGIAGVMKAVAA
jgi:hypothetical protein